MSPKLIVPFATLSVILAVLESTETIAVGWLWVVSPLLVYVGLYVLPLVVAIFLLIVAGLLLLAGMAITVIAAVAEYAGEFLSRR